MMPSEQQRCRRCGNLLGRSAEGNVRHVYRDDACYELTEHGETKLENSFRDLAAWQIRRKRCAFCEAPFITMGGRVRVWLDKGFRHYYCSPEHAAFGVEGLQKLAASGLRF